MKNLTHNQKQVLRRIAVNPAHYSVERTVTAQALIDNGYVKIATVAPIPKTGIAVMLTIKGESWLKKHNNVK